MSNTNYADTAYSLGQGPLTTMAMRPFISRRAPTTADKAPIGTLWIYVTTNAPYILTSIVNNLATWQLLEAASGAGVFSSLSVTPGPVTLVGTTNINSTGTAATLIGNATGNTAVTGSLSTTTSLAATTTVTAGTGLTVTTGNATVSTGNITATLGSVSAGTTVTAGTGITATTGNIVASTGNITSTLGSVGAATTVTAGTSITSTLGNITATNGDVVVSTATKGLVLPGGLKVITGAGDPNGAVTAPQGSLYLNSSGSSTSTRAFINSNSGTTWIAVTTAS